MGKEGLATASTFHRDGPLTRCQQKNAYTVFTIYLAIKNSIIYEFVIMYVERGERVKKLYFSGAFSTRVRVSRTT